MKFLVAIMLSLSALFCTVAQAEDGSTRLKEFHEKHKQIPAESSRSNELQ